MGLLSLIIYFFKLAIGGIGYKWNTKPKLTKELRIISGFQSKSRRNIDTRKVSSVKKADKPHKVVQGKLEMDSHAYTNVAGANCYILEYTGKSVAFRLIGRITRQSRTCQL